MLLAGGIAAGIGGLANLYGNYRAGREARSGRRAYEGQMNQHLSQQEGDINRLLAPDAYQNFTDTGQGQAMLEATRGQLQRNIQQLQGNVARGGGTTEAQMAGLSATNQGYGDIMNRMAAHGAQHQQNARQQLMFARSNLGAQRTGHAQNLYSMSQQRAGQMSNAGAQAGGAFTNLADILMQ